MACRNYSRDMAAGTPLRRLQPALLLALLLALLAPSTLLPGPTAKAVASPVTDEEKLIGWRGDTYRPTPQAPTPWVSSISWKPRSFIFHNILSDMEARHIASVAAPSMKRSTVVGPNGTSVLDDYRTSYGTFLNRYHDEVVKAIEDRVALWTRVPVVHQEDMQVLRYANGQYYHQHMDSLDNDTPRMATLLLYLSDPIEGGETSFPLSSEWTDPRLAEMAGPFTECAKGHVAFKPRKGDGLLFWSVRPDGKTEDPLSEHEGCPVVRGVKWTATVWIHTQPFRPYDYNGTHFDNSARDFVDPGLCTDNNKECAMWAAAGECDKNVPFMVGTELQAGNCRKACGKCKECKEGDRACYNRNRREVGYLAFDPEELETPAEVHDQERHMRHRMRQWGLAKGSGSDGAVDEDDGEVDNNDEELPQPYKAGGGSGGGGGGSSGGGGAGGDGELPKPYARDPERGAGAELYPADDDDSSGADDSAADASNAGATKVAGGGSSSGDADPDPEQHDDAYALLPADDEEPAAAPHSSSSSSRKAGAEDGDPEQHDDGYAVV